MVWAACSNFNGGRQCSVERITPPLVRDYPPLTLYLDNVEEIDEILKDAAGRLEFSSEVGKFLYGGGPEFSAGEYKSAILSELTEKYKNQRLRSFRIYMPKPSVNIYLERAMTRLYCADSDTASSGIFHRVDNILNRAVRRPRFVYSYIVITCVMIAGSVIPNILITVTSYYYFAAFGILLDTSVLTSAILAIILIWSFCVIYIRRRRNSLIIMSRQSQTRNFFGRNRDQFLTGLVVGLIVAVVSVFLTLAATKFFQSTPKP
jgi:hypothetical protein